MRSFLFFCILILCPVCFAHAVECDLTIKPTDNPVTQYKSRGDRCEGFYESKVSVSTIDVVGLTYGELRYALDKDEIVEVSSPAFKKTLVHIRAVGIPIKTYYRLDAQISPGKKLSWIVGDVVYPQQLSDDIIGVYGWIGSVDNKIYVPVKITAKKSGNPGNNKTTLYFRPSIDIETVKWRIFNIVNNACSSPSDWKDTPKSSYRSGQAIPIVLPDNKEFCIGIAGKEKNSASWVNKSIRVMLKE